MEIFGIVMKSSKNPHVLKRKISKVDLYLSWGEKIKKLKKKIKKTDFNKLYTTGSYRFDLISKNKNRVLNYTEIFEEYRTSSNKLNELINKKQSLIQSIDYNKFILDEIDRADILDEDLEKLENMQNSLSNFEEISSELSLGSQIISEENIGLISNLLKLKNSIDKVSKNSEKFKPISQRLDAIKIELEDIVHEIDYFLDSFEQSPENLSRVIDKIDLINNLLRKHSLHSIDELSEFRDNLAKKVDTTENIDNEIQTIETNCEELKNRLDRIALEIHNNRKLVIPDLTKEIENKIYYDDVSFKNDLKEIIGNRDFSKMEGEIIEAAIKINAFLVLAGIIGFIACFAFSLGPVMWVMLSELFPNKYRGLAIGVVGFVNSFTSWTIQQIFPWEISNLGSAITFFIYGSIALIGVFILLKILPETKGKSLEEIEFEFVKD